MPPGIDSKTMKPLYEEVQEDWSSLAIGASKLEPEPPLALPVDVEDKFTRQLVQVKWRPGDAIDLWIILPKDVKKPGAVLYLYGFDQDTDRFRNTQWDERVTAGGVAAVCFVSALSGQRFHDRPMEQWFVSELQESIGSTVHDVKFILDYLAQRGDIDMDRIAMFGEGSGGAIAILSAAADPRIKAVDTLEPWGDWPDFLAKASVVQDDAKHDDFVKPAFLKKVEPLDPVKYLPQLKIPLRVIQVHQVTTPPSESQDKIKDALPKQAELLRFEDMMAMGSRLGNGRLFDWTKLKLQEAAKQPGKLSADGKTGTQIGQNGKSEHP
ncbi:MAG TPA: alpha/beta hydrolase [Candidatus Binatia bacterium]|nr:alpha/beta hydrolase [Candidatus Binatia bacterium]